MLQTGIQISSRNFAPLGLCAFSLAAVVTVLIGTVHTVHIPCPVLLRCVFRPIHNAVSGGTDRMITRYVGDCESSNTSTRPRRRWMNSIRTGFEAVGRDVRTE